MHTTGYGLDFFDINRLGMHPRLNGGHFLVRGALGMWVPNIQNPKNLVKAETLPDWATTGSPTFTRRGLTGGNLNTNTNTVGLSPTAIPYTIAGIYFVNSNNLGVFSSAGNGTNSCGFNLGGTSGTTTVQAFHGNNTGNTLTTASQFRRRQSSFALTQGRVYVVVAQWTSASASPDIYINGYLANGTATGTATTIVNNNHLVTLGRCGAATGAGGSLSPTELLFVGAWNRLLTTDEIRDFSERPLRLFGGGWDAWTNLPGATNYTVGVAGTLTLAGSIIRTTGKQTAGTQTSSGTIVRHTAKSTAGTQAIAGTVAKQTAKSTTGSLTPSGALTKAITYGRALAGTLTSAGSLVRNTAKVLAGTGTSSGAVVRHTAKSTAGTVTPSGVIAKQWAHTFTGALTSAGALAVSVVRVLTMGGTLTLSGALVRQTNKVLAGTTTSSGTLVKHTAKSLVGAVTPSGALAKLITKTMAGTVTSAGALAKQWAKTLTGSTASSGALVRQTNKVVAGTQASSGGIVRQTAKVLAGTQTSAGGLVKQWAHTFTGTTTSSGALSRSSTFARSFTGTLTPSGSISNLVIVIIAPLLGNMTVAAFTAAKSVKALLSSVFRVVASPFMASSTTNNLLTGEITVEPFNAEITTIPR